MSAHRKHTHHGEGANVLAAFGFTVGMITVMHVIGNATLLDMMIATPPFMFMVYTAMDMIGKKKAKRAEDQNDIQSIFDLVSQCIKSLSLIDEAVTRSAVDVRTYMALNRLAITTRLFISRYGRYLDRRGVWAALEVENLVAKAELAGEKDLKRYVSPIRDYITDIGANVIGMDDPRLEAAR